MGNTSTKALVDNWRNNKNLMHMSDGAAIGFNRFEHTNWMDEQLGRYTLWTEDWSNIPTVNIKGSQALDLLKKVCINKMDKWGIDQAKHVVCCNNEGKVVAEGIGVKLTEDEYQLQAAPAAHITAFAAANDYELEVTWRQKFYTQVSGPRVLLLLKKLFKEDFRDLEFMHRMDITTLDGIRLEVMRQSMTGDLGGFEIQGPIELHDELVSRVLAAGEGLGLVRNGQRVGQVNHYEAGIASIGTQYIPAPMDINNAYSRTDTSDLLVGGDPNANVFGLVGSFESDDINDYFDSPFAWGWGRYIDWDRDFIGRDALKREKDAGNLQTLVTLELDNADVIDVFASQFQFDEEPYRHMEIPTTVRVEVYKDRIENDKGELIGISTIPMYTRAYRRVIVMAHVKEEYAKDGTRVSVIWGNPGHRMKKIHATVAPAPYRRPLPDNRFPHLETVDRRGDLYTLEY
jgi:vanillate/3-O-methylgallate O-demethylase